MPTFHFFKKGNRIEEMRGANPGELERLVRKHAFIPKVSTNFI